jgi:hypothetical protein
MQSLVPQPVTINFAKGVNLKTDPWQVPMGEFLALENSIFTTQGQLRKRNGYGLITTIQDAATITTYLNDLVALGSDLSLFSQSTNTVIDTGAIQPMGLSVLPMVRSATSQKTVDAAIAPNGLCCETWLDSNGNSYYQINNSVTGGTIVPSVSITSGTEVNATMSRVFVLGNYFVVTYLATVSAAPALRYIAIPLNNPTAPLAPVNISTAITSIASAYDGVVTKINAGVLYLAWADGTAMKLNQLSNSLVLGTVVTLTGATANLISVTFDSTALENKLWVSFYNSSASTIDVAAFNSDITPNLAITTIVSSVTLNNGLTSTAQNGKVSVFYEVQNFYGFDSTLETDILSYNTCTLSGTVGTPSIILRGVGLSSKAVISNGQSYMLICYSSVFQPTYFLINSTGNIIGKVAYSNGGGYIINQILPQINVGTNSDDLVTFQVGYLFKDFLASIANPIGPFGSNVGTNSTMGASAPPIYTQSGINVATWTFNAPVASAETGRILHMGVGFPLMFDGVKPVEHQFHIWPDAIEASTANSGGGLSAQQYYYQGIYNWTDGQGNPQYSAPSVPVGVVVAAGSGITFDSVFSSGESSIVVSSASGLFVGQSITDTTTGSNIQAGTKITKIVGTTITLSLPTAGNSTTTPGDVLKTVDQGVNTVFFPTLRLTDKTINKVRLNLYRWSTANQNFFEVTSVQTPVLNDLTVDYLTITDNLNDLVIQGNSLIYTTGGVVEDIAAPSFSICSMFDDRLWIVNNEDPFSMWYSKQVIEGTGVEFSDLFTYYVAPTQGAQGSTGPITALAPMDTELIMFKQDAIFYLNGTGPDNTGAGSTYSQPIYISSTVGCSNPNSIVQTDDGIMFQSDKGIWLLSRGLQPFYIGQAVERLVLGNIVTSANIIPGTTQARFILNTGITLMYDYLYKQWGWFTNTPGISGTLYQGLHTYLDSFGRIVQETPGKYLDISTPVNMYVLSNWIQLQGLSGYQRFLELQLLGAFITPHNLNVEFGYDFGPLSEQAEIEPLNNTGNYGTDALFGQTSPYGGPGSLEQWRVQNAHQQCQSFQVSIQEVYDSTQGIPAGAGLTLSAFTAIVGVTRGYRPIAGQNTVGTNGGS